MMYKGVCNPNLKSGEIFEQIGATNRGTTLSRLSAQLLTTQHPTDLELGPNPQTHLFFGCCTVRVICKPAFPHFQKKIVHPRVCTWSLITVRERGSITNWGKSGKSAPDLGGGGGCDTALVGLSPGLGHFPPWTAGSRNTTPRSIRSIQPEGMPKWMRGGGWGGGGSGVPPIPAWTAVL